MNLFTDWSLSDPRYFYGRGALWGFVAATFLWLVVVPWLCKKLKERPGARQDHEAS